MCRFAPAACRKFPAIGPQWKNSSSKNAGYCFPVREKFAGGAGEEKRIVNAPFRRLDETSPSQQPFNPALRRSHFVVGPSKGSAY